MEDIIASLDPHLIYVFLAVLTFGESAAFLSLVFPGEVALVAAAALAVSTGVDPVVLAGVATSGALAGGFFGYAVGRRYGPRIVAWQPIERRMGRRINELRPLVDGQEAAALVAVARFNQITRAVVPVLAGMAGMGRVRFGIANGVGALIWAGAFTAVGFYAAEWWQSTSGFVHLVAAVAVAIAVGWWLLTRWRSKVSMGDAAKEMSPDD